MPFQKTFRILLEEDNTDGSILDSIGGASFLTLNGTDTSGAMNADSAVLGVDGTAAEGKPGWLTEAADGSGDYAKEKCIATNSGWVFMPGSTATGSDNTNSQPEVIECHRRLKDTIDVPTGRQLTIGTGAFITCASFTDRQAMRSTPAARRSSALATNSGRCFAEQVEVKAPGSANRIVLPLAKYSVDSWASTPSSVLIWKVACGMA